MGLISNTVDYLPQKALKVQILNEVALIQVVRKRVSFQDRKNENTPKFPMLESYSKHSPSIKI